MRPLGSALALATAFAFASGCSAILGIPGEVSVSDGSDSGPTPSEAGTDAPIPDAGSDVAKTDAPTDAPVDARPPSCDPSKPFGTPTMLTTLSSAEFEGSPRVSDDELTVYIDAVRAPGAPTFDLYQATRTTVTDSFGALVPIPSTDLTINTANDEYAPTVADKGLVLMFERYDFATTNNDLYIATRTSTTLPFGTATAVTALNSGNFEGNPYLNPSATEVWYTRVAGGNADIWRAKREPGVGYTTSKVTEVSGPLNDYNPVISADELTIYFASQRPGVSAGIDGNVWVATRTTPTGTFSTPTEVVEVNSTADEYPASISSDGCRLYLVSQRPGLGKQDIYVAAKPK